MFPNLFLKRFWEMKVRAEVFVAMSFDAEYEHRYQRVIVPAIESEPINGKQYKARRVDLSKTGDSILTEIADGIAHCAVVLADVSTVGHDTKTGRPFRNGNVMYEVGLALACRNPSEILIVHDDHHPLLFDLSTIPHKRIDFTEATAIQQLKEALRDRLAESKTEQDARVENAVASLTDDELNVIRRFGTKQPGRQLWNFRDTGSVNFLAMAAIPRLLDKRMIRVAGSFGENSAAYTWTELGGVVVNRVLKNLPSFIGIEEKIAQPNAKEAE